jgi:hypothetical protein
MALLPQVFKQRRQGFLDGDGHFLGVFENLLFDRRNWARLIQKIYEVEPLICPKCKGAMRVISSIEDPSVIRDILNHLGMKIFRQPPNAQ